MSTLSVWTPGDEIVALVASSPSVGLERLDEMAALQTRRDRKYVLTPGQAAEALGSVIDRMAALEIGGRRTFTYRSLYLDTADRVSYRGAATGRRRRFKVRLRQYVDTGTAVLEVKTRTGRGETVKQRIAYDAAADRGLTAEGRAFVDEVLGVEGLADRLRPAVWTAYRRSTLVDLDDRSRVTVDTRLGSSVDGERWLGLTDAVIVETKASGAATPLDRALWAMACRPVSISKFGVAMAIEDPTLPAAKWRRTMRRHFDRPAALVA